MNESTARNIRVQNRYDELMGIGKHGHYETMFRVVREETESLRQQLEFDHAEYKRLRDDMRQQLADSQKQVTLLRDGLKRADDLLTHSYDHVSPLIREALAATEPKP